MNFTFNKLVELSTHDQSVIIELDNNYFPHPWTVEQWQSCSDRYYVATDESGFVLFELGLDQVALLHKILVHPEKRRLGQARKYWEEALVFLQSHQITSVLLEVSETNHTALKFYEKLGFLALNRVKSFYSDGSNAIRMLLTLQVTACLHCSFALFLL